MRTRSALLIAAICGLYVACGGNSSDEPRAGSPEASMLKFFEHVDKGQWGPAWELFHPAHQEIVSRSTYIECQSGTSIDVDAEVVDSYEERVDVPEVGEVDSVALTVKLTGDVGIFGLPGETTDTFHVIDVDGDWRLIITAENLEAYADGDCP